MERGAGALNPEELAAHFSLKFLLQFVEEGFPFAKISLTPQRTLKINNWLNYGLNSCFLNKVIFRYSGKPLFIIVFGFPQF